MAPAQQFKESTIVVIDTGRTQLRAGRGLGELLPLPTANVQARVGIRRTEIPKTNDVMDAIGAPQPPPPGLRASNYLVGHHLDEALAAGEEVDIWWPFLDGAIADWVQAEALWKYVLFYCLHLRRTLNEFPVMLAIPRPLSAPDYQKLARVFFERFNVAAFSVSDRAVAQIFAANSVSGIVVDVEDDRTDISCVVDGFVVHGGMLSVPLGLTDCINHLADVLASSPNITSVLSPAEAPLPLEQFQPTMVRLAEYLYNSGHISPPATVAIADAQADDEAANIASLLVAGKEKALIEANSKKKSVKNANAAEREKEKERLAMDLLDIEFEGKKLTLSKERHRMCEPLLDGDLLKSWTLMGLKDPITCMTIPEAINTVTRELDVPLRPVVWEGVQVTGRLSSIKTFKDALVSQLQVYVPRDPSEYGLGQNGQPVESQQPRSVKAIRVPDYFAHYRDTGDPLAAFLGSSIIAKLTFNEPNGRFLSKSDYSSKGPSAMLELI